MSQAAPYVIGAAHVPAPMIERGITEAPTPRRPRPRHVTDSAPKRSPSVPRTREAAPQPGPRFHPVRLQLQSKTSPGCLSTPRDDQLHGKVEQG